MEKDTFFGEMISFLSFFFSKHLNPFLESRKTKLKGVPYFEILIFTLTRRLSISLIEHLSSEKIDGENSFRGKCSFNGGKVGVDEVDRAIVCGRGEF